MVIWEINLEISWSPISIGKPSANGGFSVQQAVTLSQGLPRLSQPEATNDEIVRFRRRRAMSRNEKGVTKKLKDDPHGIADNLR